MSIALIALAAAGALLLALPGCGSGADERLSARENVARLARDGVKPNEMGMVMLLEYHRVTDSESAYTRSIENFRKDLETLYAKGYRLVTFKELMSGRIDVPAGMTPVSVSFDDSTEGQFRYIREGVKTIIDPECALGLMKAFYEKHRDFGYTALFNVLPTLFDQPKYRKRKLSYLLDNGFELGNHTVSHLALGKLPDEDVQKEIATAEKEMKSVDPRVKFNILCLPLGSLPKNQSLMYDGSYEGAAYHNDWSLLVGSNPFYPSYHYRNPGRLVPRIQCMNFNPGDGSGAEGSDYWLRYFDRHPELRYVSDGNPDTICAPAYMETRLLKNKLPSGVSFVGY